MHYQLNAFLAAPEIGRIEKTASFSEKLYFSCLISLKKQLMKQCAARCAILSTFLFFSILLKAQFAVFNPAEFEKNEGLLLVWDYSASRDSITANIAKAAQQAGKVWIMYIPEHSTVDTSEIRNYLYSRGVTSQNLFFIPTHTETLWIRDFGPMTLYGNYGQGNERFIVDMGYSQYNRPFDDSVPQQLAQLWNWQHSTLDLEIEGGNLIFDGLKRGFASTRVYEQNPQFTPAMIRNMLIDKFSLDDFTFLESLHNSGGGIWKHVDMFMKVLDYETILVSSYPEHLPDYPVIESNVDVLRNLTNAFGKPYQIIRIPAPPKADGSWATTQNDEMRTYTNSVMINNTVIVPSYGLPDYDEHARQIYMDALPGYKIVMVDAQNLTPLGGAIHCVTKEIPAPDFVRIVHRKVTGIQAFSSEFYIYSNCEASANLQEMWLYYKKDQADDYTKVPVYMACPQNIGIIEGLKPGDTIHYYLEASSSQFTTTYPLGAPAANFKFWLDGTVGMEEITATTAGLLVFPQPSNGSFQVVTDGQPIQQLEIWDVSGKLVYKQSNPERPYFFQFDLEPGFYVLRAATASKDISSRLIVTSR